MIELLYLKKYIDEELLRRNKERDKAHKSSGKLSASVLGNPLQWQILKTIGVPKKEINGYTARKFLRGNHVEDWLRDFTPNIVEKEKFVEYRNVVGYIDALVDMTGWGIPNISGTIPHEIKSVTNASFKWIKISGAKKGHLLQACVYAMALGKKHFIINYVASDDYRVKTFLFDVKPYAKEVNEIIDAYDKQIKLGIVPVFEAKEKWQSNEKYNNYPEFSELSAAKIKLLLKTKYMKSYDKLLLKGGVSNG